MHSAGIAHRDLKPGNIMVNKTLELKLSDFGLAKVLKPSLHTDVDNTDNVVTQFYRAPELLMKYGLSDYSTKIDMWSVGCIIAEMVLREPLFDSENENEQIRKTIELVGPVDPAKSDLIKSERILTILGETSPKKNHLNHVLQGANSECLDLIKKLLTYDPESRLSAE